MATKKEINVFLKSIPIAKLCWSIDDCTEAINKLHDFATLHNIPYSEYSKPMKSRYRSLCNKRRNIWNNCLK